MPLFPELCVPVHRQKRFKLEKRSFSGGCCVSRRTHRGALSPIFQPRGRGSFQQGLIYQSCSFAVKLAFSALR